MQHDLDAIDKKIIDLLREDARMPTAAMAARIGLSRQAVRMRMDRLEKAKIIVGYTVRLGSSHGEEAAVEAIIMVYRRDRMRGADVTKAIAKIPEVIRCSVLSGQFDLLVQVRAPSQDKLTDIWQTIANLPGVVDTHTSFILSSVVERPPLR